MITAARVDKHGRDGGVILLEFKLCEARVITAPCCEDQCCRMAGVSEYDSRRISIRSSNRDHRHIVIHWAHKWNAFGDQIGNVGFSVVATVNCKRCFPVASFNTRGGQGCKGVILSNPKDHLLVDCPEAALDVDTPEDYAACLATAS